jgi:hypothetical protein
MTRLLTEGETVQVWGPEEAPEGFFWRGEPHRIEGVSNRWQVHTRWWEAGEVVWREYYKVTTDRGVLCELVHDRLRGEWRVGRVYD